MGVFGDVFKGIGSLGSNIALLAGAAGEGGADEINRIVRLWRKMQLPEFDFSDIEPAELTMVAEYFPNVYEAVVPDEVKVAQDSPELRDAQMRGLAHLERVAQEGIPLADRLAVQEVGRALAREARSASQGVIEDLRARGRGGGGLELQARLAGAQQGAELARGFGSDIARQAVLNRLRAASEAGNLAGAIRAQDYGIRSDQAQTINRFNEWVSALMTQAAADAAAARERAHFANVGEQQRLADFNAINRQQTETENLQRRNMLRQLAAENQFRRLAGLSSALAGKAQSKDAEAAARAEAIRSIGAGAGQALGGMLDIGTGLAAPGGAGGSTAAAGETSLLDRLYNMNYGGRQPRVIMLSQ